MKNVSMLHANHAKKIFAFTVGVQENQPWCMEINTIES